MKILDAVNLARLHHSTCMPVYCSFYSHVRVSRSTSNLPCCPTHSHMTVKRTIREHFIKQSFLRMGIA